MPKHYNNELKFHFLETLTGIQTLVNTNKDNDAIKNIVNSYFYINYASFIKIVDKLIKNDEQIDTIFNGGLIYKPQNLQFRSYILRYCKFHTPYCNDVIIFDYEDDDYSEYQKFKYKGSSKEVVPRLAIIPTLHKIDNLFFRFFTPIVKLYFKHKVSLNNCQKEIERTNELYQKYPKGFIPLSDIYKYEDKNFVFSLAGVSLKTILINENLLGWHQFLDINSWYDYFYLERKYEVILQLIKIVFFLQKEGYIHGDIKLDNIVIIFTYDGKFYVKLIDNEPFSHKNTLGYELICLYQDDYMRSTLMQTLYFIHFFAENYSSSIIEKYKEENNLYKLAKEKITKFIDNTDCLNNHRDIYALIIIIFFWLNNIYIVPLRTGSHKKERNSYSKLLFFLQTDEIGNKLFTYFAQNIDVQQIIAAFIKVFNNRTADKSLLKNSCTDNMHLFPLIFSRRTHIPDNTKMKLKI